MKEAKLRFIFIAPCVGEAFFDPVKKGAADATKLMNAECVFDGTADVNINQQIDLIREATMNGYDGIAVSLVHSTAFNQVVEESLKAGIPIVAFNVDSGDPGNRRLSAVCQNLRYAGQVLGAKAADSIAQDSHVLITIHSDGISALEDRLQGMKDALSVKNITTQVIVTGITPHGAAEKIERALRQILEPRPSCARVRRIPRGRVWLLNNISLLTADISRDLIYPAKSCGSSKMVSLHSPLTNSLTCRVSIQSFNWHSIAAMESCHPTSMPARP